MFVPMQLEIIETDDGFRLKGELDMATAGDLSEVLRTASGRADPMVLDLSEVSFMDSSGLRALLDAAGLPEEQQADGVAGSVATGAQAARHQHPGRDTRTGGPAAERVKLRFPDG